MEPLLEVMAHAAGETNANERANPSHDEILIDFLIDNPCLWDKSDHDFRNRVKKEYKWKEVAQQINMAAHEAIRRYKTLCERFRREMIKQSSIPNFTSTWCLFDKFAALKDAQSSDERKYRVKEEPPENYAIDLAALAAATAAATSTLQTPKVKKRKRKSHGSTSVSEYNNGTMTNGNGIVADTEYPNCNEHNGLDNTSGTQADTPLNLERIFNNKSTDDDQDSCESMHVEPTYVGGSTDLSTDAIAAFCQFLEASLKQLNTDRSDELIEDISMMLFRKKREFKSIDASNAAAKLSTHQSQSQPQPQPQSQPPPSASSSSNQTPSHNNNQPINEFTT